VLLGEGKRNRAPVGVPDDDRACDVQLAEQFHDRLQLTIERDVAPTRVAEPGPVDRDRAMPRQQRRDLVEVFRGPRQTVDQQHRRAAARPFDVVNA
jgi:hypothetical protein